MDSTSGYLFFLLFNLLNIYLLLIKKGERNESNKKKKKKNFWVSTIDEMQNTFGLKNWKKMFIISLISYFTSKPVCKSYCGCF
jgi:hypothetical protein